MAPTRKIIDVLFFITDQGRIPVKEWLKELTPADRKIIGDNMRTVELGWPIGMPIVRKIDTGLYGKSALIYRLSEN